MRLYYVTYLAHPSDEMKQDRRRWFPSRRKAEAYATQLRREEREDAWAQVDHDSYPTLVEQRKSVKQDLSLITIEVEKVEFKATKQGILDLLTIYAEGDIAPC
jgi:hypothetical protein